MKIIYCQFCYIDSLLLLFFLLSQRYLFWQIILKHSLTCNGTVIPWFVRLYFKIIQWIISSGLSPVLVDKPWYNFKSVDSAYYEMFHAKDVGLFPAILGKGPWPQLRKLINLTTNLGESNDIEHNKGSEIYQNQVILDCIMPTILL